MLGVKVVLQRVSRASVSVSGIAVGSIGPGLCLLVGIGHDDTRSEVEAAVDKITGLRVFADESGLMNKSVADIGGEILLISQFTLLGEVSRGRRPSFSNAGAPELARGLIDLATEGFRSRGIHVETGEFGSKMEVEIVNDGPVTLTIQFRDGKVL
jgi:D-tyrosyl-tRNA(Tyr) deacylase